MKYDPPQTWMVFHAWAWDIQNDPKVAQTTGNYAFPPLICRALDLIERELRSFFFEYEHLLMWNLGKKQWFSTSLQVGSFSTKQVWHLILHQEWAMELLIGSFTADPWHILGCPEIYITSPAKILENWWLEDEMSFKDGPFSGDMLIFRGESNISCWNFP